MTDLTLDYQSNLRMLQIVIYNVLVILKVDKFLIFCINNEND